MKFRSDFVTNSSASSFVVEVFVETKENDVFTLALDPSDCFGGSGGSSDVYIDDDGRIERIFSARSVDELVSSVLNTVDLRSELGVLMDSTVELPKDFDNWNTESQLEFAMNHLDEDYNDEFEGVIPLINAIKEFKSKVRFKVESPSDVRMIVFREVNCSWGEFVFDAFESVLKRWIDDADSISNEEILSRLKERLSDDYDFSKIEKVLKDGYDGDEQWGREIIVDFENGIVRRYLITD